jgi:plastocyanin domain-containing protein
MAAPVLASAHEHDPGQRPSDAADSSHEHHTMAAKRNGNARTIEVAVTSEGFVPAEVKVKKGEKVNLVVTRKTDKTCATALVMKEKGINVDLPLNKPVAVALKADKRGELKYACPMDMIVGKIVVE